jgi:hypothetical protein
LNDVSLGKNETPANLFYELQDMYYPEAFSRKWDAEGDWDGRRQGAAAPPAVGRARHDVPAEAHLR